jgi:hypothetical protein
MKNNNDIPTTDATEIKRLINRVKQGELDTSQEKAGLTTFRVNHRIG